MLIKKSRIIEQVIVLVVLALVFLYDAFVDYLGFLDELLGLFSFVIVVIYVFLRSKIKLLRNEFYIILILFFIAFIGLISNYIAYKNGYRTELNAILGDFIVFFKAFMAYIGIRFFSGYFNSQKILYTISKYSKLIFYLLLLLVLLDLIFKIFPQWHRFGIPSLQLFFQHPSRYGFAFAFIALLLLSHDFIKKKSLIFFVILIGALSLRVKYLGFAILFAFILICGKRLFRIPKMVFVYIIAIVALLLLWFFWDAFEMYFTFESIEDAWSRAVVLYYSFIIGVDFFPLGTGFGTFSSYYSGLYYSWVYDLYGISKVYGISRLYWGFMADQYWPMVLGQFGFLGFTGMVLILYQYFKIFINNIKVNINNPKRYYYISALLGLMMLIIDSTSDAIFSQQRGVVMFIFFALIVNTIDSNEKK